VQDENRCETVSLLDKASPRMVGFKSAVVEIRGGSENAFKPIGVNCEKADRSS
jgi:hypothetical protein